MAITRPGRPPADESQVRLVEALLGKGFSCAQVLEHPEVQLKQTKVYEIYRYSKKEKEKATPDSAATSPTTENDSRGDSPKVPQSA